MLGDHFKLLNKHNMNSLDVLALPKDDPIAFTFFTGYMAMMAASVFFFFERGSVDGKWKLSLLVSGLITGIVSSYSLLFLHSPYTL